MITARTTQAVARAAFCAETILFDNEIILNNETNLFGEKFHCGF